MTNVTLVILAIILVIVLVLLWYNYPVCEKCKPCPTCPDLPSVGNFLARATQKYDDTGNPQTQQPTLILNDTPEETDVKKKRACRLDQDSKNIFSNFFKHQCKKTPYTNF